MLVSYPFSGHTHLPGMEWDTPTYLEQNGTITIYWDRIEPHLFTGMEWGHTHILEWNGPHLPTGTEWGLNLMIIGYYAHT